MGDITCLNILNVFSVYIEIVELSHRHLDAESGTSGACFGSETTYGGGEILSDWIGVLF